MVHYSFGQAGYGQFALIRENLERQRWYAVAEVGIKYVRPAKLGDDLLVLSTVSQVRAASVVIHQRVMRGSELLADARVTAAFLDHRDRPKRQPRAWVETFKSISET